MTVNWKWMAVWGALLAGLLLIGYAARDDLAVYVGQGVGAFSSEEIQGSLTVGQTFTAPYPGLNRIAVKMHTFDRVNTHDVILHLKQGREAGEDIWTDTFNGHDVQDGKWQVFSFAPLSGSAGVTYYFYFESPQSTPGNAVAVMGEEDDPYPNGAAYQGNEALPGDMAFKAYYKASWREKYDFLLARLTANKPSVWGNHYFYIGLGFVYLFMIIVFIGFMARHFGTGEADHDPSAG